MIYINEHVSLDPKLIVGTSWDYPDKDEMDDSDQVYFVVHMTNGVSVRIKHERSHLCGVVGGMNALKLEEDIANSRVGIG